MKQRVWSIDSVILPGETEVLGESPIPLPLVHHSSYLDCPGNELGSDRPRADRLSYGTASRCLGFVTVVPVGEGPVL